MVRPTQSVSFDSFFFFSFFIDHPLTDFLLTSLFSSVRSIEKQISSKSSNCSPAHRAHQKKADTGEFEENHSSAPSQDAHLLESNGLLVPMEQEKENEDKQDTNERTAGILNGDIGDGNTGQEDEGSYPQADWTGTESHAGNEDLAGTESEHRQSEGVADHKVSAPRLWS